MRAMRLPNNRTIVACRTIGITAACLLAFYSVEANAALQRTWDALRTWKLFQHDSFEPFVVTVSGIVWTIPFVILDKYVPAAKRWRIQKSDDMQHWKIEGLGRFRQEFLLYWAVLGPFDWLYPRRKLPVHAPTVLQFGLEVLGALLIYDLLFFFVHVACHKVPFLYRHVHAKHHTKKVVRACETWRLSIWEEIADVACSIAALNLLKCHPLSRAAYNVVIIYLIIELHSGYDMPWMLQNVVPWGLWAGSRRHDVHHQYGKSYYQKFFTYLDNAIGLVANKSNVI